MKYDKEAVLRNQELALRATRAVGHLSTALSMSLTMNPDDGFIEWILKAAFESAKEILDNGEIVWPLPEEEKGP